MPCQQLGHNLVISPLLRMKRTERCWRGCSVLCYLLLILRTSAERTALSWFAYLRHRGHQAIWTCCVFFAVCFFINILCT